MMSLCHNPKRQKKTIVERIQKKAAWIKKEKNMVNKEKQRFFTPFTRNEHEP